MINKVSFTLKGDFQEMTMNRDEGSSYISISLSYHNGIHLARFKLEDFKKALEILEAQEE